MSKDDITTYANDPEHRFTGLPLKVEYVDGLNWKLENDVTYCTKADEVLTVRSGFMFDFASVPRALWWLYPPTGTKGNPYGIAALLHDWLILHRKIGGRPITRKEADLLFLEIMLYSGCRKSLAYTMYSAVRAHGMMPWNQWK